MTVLAEQSAETERPLVHARRRDRIRGECVLEREGGAAGGSAGGFEPAEDSIDCVVRARQWRRRVDRRTLIREYARPGAERVLDLPVHGIADIPSKAGRDRPEVGVTDSPIRKNPRTQPALGQDRAAISSQSAPIAIEAHTQIQGDAAARHPPVVQEERIASDVNTAVDIGDPDDPTGAGLDDRNDVTVHDHRAGRAHLIAVAIRRRFRSQ